LFIEAVEVTAGNGVEVESRAENEEEPERVQGRIKNRGRRNAECLISNVELRALTAPGSDRGDYADLANG
jgi:hypothetical protein